MMDVGCWMLDVYQNNFLLFTFYFLLSTFQQFKKYFVTFHEKEKPIAYTIKLHGKSFIGQKSD